VVLPTGVGFPSRLKFEEYRHCIFFWYRPDKILVFFELREVDRGPSLQNLRTKGLMGKIFRNMELGEASRWRVEVFSVGCEEETLGTVPLCAFCILGKGCSSQERGIFLWKAVEKRQTGRCSQRSRRDLLCRSVGSGFFELHFRLGSQEVGVKQEPSYT